MVLKSRVRAPDWSAHGDTDKEAKCRKHPLPTNHDPNAESDPWFYAEQEGAKVCNGTLDGRVCPFRDPCLYGALVNNEQSGVWGGLITIQRQWVRRQRAEDSQTPIHREAWDDPEQWLHLVPTPAFFEQTAEDDSASTDQPQEADRGDGSVDRGQEEAHDADGGHPAARGEEGPGRQ